MRSTAQKRMYDEKTGPKGPVFCAAGVLSRVRRQKEMVPGFPGTISFVGNDGALQN